MSDIKYFNFHIGDWLGDTMHLNATESGAYLNLILYHYRVGKKGLPDNQKKLAQIAKCTPRQWPNVWESIRHFFVLENEHWLQKRVLEEHKKFHSKSTAARDKALKRWNSDDATASSQQSQGNANQKPITNKNTNTSSKEVVVRGEPVDNSEGKKFFEKGFYDIVSQLSDKDIRRAKESAPGWDIYYLANIYNTNVADKKLDRPKFPGKAFAGWCKKYTKGNHP